MNLNEIRERSGGRPVIERRELAVELRAVDGSDELEFTFSSEQPVERWFGREVLSHEPGAADLSRLNDGAPFLWNHDRDDVLGVVLQAAIGDDRRGKAKVKWSRNSKAQEKRQDVEDGILRNVSFAYSIDDAEEREEGVVVTKWTPLEVSLVSIPADNSVGLGRSLDEMIADRVTELVHSLRSEESEPSKDGEDSTESDAAQVAEETEAASAAPDTQTDEPMEAEAPNLEVIRSEAVTAERDRITAINALGQKHGLEDLARELIEGGKSLAESREAFLDKIDSRAMKPAPIESADSTKNDLGLSEKEVKRFSFMRALNALANPGDKKAWEAAAFEREVSEAASKKYDKPANGIMVPNEILRRDLVVGTPSAGGDLVATDLLAGSFIDLLRNRLALAQVGVTMLTGLQGFVSIPRQSSAATAYWVGEGSSPDESQQSVDQVPLAPHTVGAYVDYSRRLLLQSSIDVESMIRSDLARVIALEIDRAAIYGSGNSNQPKGLTLQDGIGSVSLTGFGTFPEIVELETEVATANADFGSLFYLVNASTRGAMKTTSLAGSEARFVFENNEMNGYPVVVTNQLQNKDIIFGNFSEMVMGMWSGLDLTVDPYHGSTSGTVRIVALQDVDVAVRQPGAFAYGQSSAS